MLEAAGVSRKQRAIQSLKDAAIRAVTEGDPWAQYDLGKTCPAERVIRHLYQPTTGTWKTDETIVKMQTQPFTHGAMRFCYRLKKRAQPPESATNHRFHKTGWSTASNYVAKAYHKNGEIDCSEEAKAAVRNDIMLQYEAAHWAELFNNAGPPTKIHFIRAYALEFPDRVGKPWFAVERFISGHDRYGAVFVKHNTNAGFVDTELHRVTPQVFSAFSFYSSEGTRLVADIQGVGDLYTDPQVLSSDYRFGDGDLGPRGMALFFKTFRHCGVSDSLGIPTFPLSRNEIRHQAKYDDDEVTVSDDEHTSLESKSHGDGSEMDDFQRMDIRRIRRASVLLGRPLLGKSILVEDEGVDDSKRLTERRGNVSQKSVILSIRKSRTSPISSIPKPYRKSKSDLSELRQCLDRALQDRHFTHRDFHRHASGALRSRHFKVPVGEDNTCTGVRRSTVVRQVSEPIDISARTRENLSKVHYQLAVLHGMNRFPDVVPEGDGSEEPPSHDVFSVLFHLSYASAHRNAAACLSLARVQAGLRTCVSDLLGSAIQIDFDHAKDLLRRAMTCPFPPARPKAAAGCLLYHILQDERNQDIPSQEDEDVITPERPSDTEMIQVLEDTIGLLKDLENESKELAEHKLQVERNVLVKGDRVEANYALEGTFYPGVLTMISEDGMYLTVKYDDDGSSEVLEKDNVRPLIPATATQTSLGGPLSDEEAFDSEENDDQFLSEIYELQASLAELKESIGDTTDAARLYEEASTGALEDGKMKSASLWSLKAAELENDKT